MKNETVMNQLKTFYGPNKKLKSEMITDRTPQRANGI
jgi:hypothetical protein